MMHADRPRSAILYFLFTYGPRHTTKDLTSRPGAKMQAALMFAYSRRAGLDPSRSASDYIRRPRDADDFLELYRLIEECAVDPTRPAIVISDISKVLGRRPNAQIAKIMRKLTEHEGIVHDARLGLPLSQVHPQDLKVLIRSDDRIHLAKANAQKSAKQREAVNTRPAWARRKSTIVRAAKADHNARQLATIRDELARDSDGRQPGHADVARAANERGFRTTRGGDWTSTTVSRALKRIQSDGAEDV